MQMPLVDGFSSTTMIRSFEQTHSPACLSHRATLNARIPIFAVSASSVEQEKARYVATGFDGWIVKPIDFHRVDALLKGIIDPAARRACLHQPGQWERSGWFANAPPPPPPPPRPVVVDNPIPCACHPPPPPPPPRHHWPPTFLKSYSL
jgi:DNA-binding response OmpR family regulator